MARRSRRAPTGMAALIGLAVAVFFGISVSGRQSDGPDPAGGGTVVRVVDGDTVVVQLGGSEEPVRLIGIDTPESVAEDRPKECYGPEASQRLAELLPAGTHVRLERDVEPRDRYDRLLAYLYRADDDLFVNQDQVANGFAIAKEYPPNTTRSAELTAAQQTAQAQNAGLWGACGGADVPLR